MVGINTGKWRSRTSAGAITHADHEAANDAKKAFIDAVREDPEGRKDLVVMSRYITAAWDELAKFDTLEALRTRAQQMQDTITEDSTQKITSEAKKEPKFTDAQKRLFAAAVETHVAAVTLKLIQAYTQEKKRSR